MIILLLLLLIYYDNVVDINNKYIYMYCCYIEYNWYEYFIERNS